MRLSKVKTDKSDAKAICDYGKHNDVPLYSALTEVQAECLQLFRLLDIYIKQRTAIKNKIKGEEALGKPSRFVYQSLKRNQGYLTKEIKGLEERLLELVKSEKPEILESIQKSGKIEEDIDKILSEVITNYKKTNFEKK